MEVQQSAIIQLTNLSVRELIQFKDKNIHNGVMFALKGRDARHAKVHTACIDMSHKNAHRRQPLRLQVLREVIYR